MTDKELSEVGLTPLKVIYLGISGVLHPSWSFYESVFGRCPDADGHRKYEAVEVLHQALLPWPDARIVLTSTQPWDKGLPAVLQQLGPLAPRTIGYTFEDLTVRVPQGRRGRPMTEQDYWRCSKSQVVDRHVEWLCPSAWIAIDDEDYGWGDDIASQHLVATTGTKGLLDPAARDRLTTVLYGNFRSPTPGQRD